MHLINGAQFLSITTLFLLSATSSPAPVIAIVPLTSVYTSRILDLRIVVLNLISLPVVCPQPNFLF